jgi:hypothetical protein
MSLRRLLFELSMCSRPSRRRRRVIKGVETAGLEPATPCLQSRCSPS